MEIQMGTVIKNKRKEKGVTQQELADFVGVSKASVSKWESHQSYPDITLLPIIATYFDISLDDLFNYETQLTAKQIRRIYQSLQTDVQNKPAEEVMETLSRFVRRYYSSHSFVLHMGLFILNHQDYLAKTPEQKNELLLYAKELFTHVKANTSEADLLNYSTMLSGLTLLLLGQSKKVLELIGESISVDYGSDTLIIAAWQAEGNLLRAKEAAQAAIYQTIISLLNRLTNYLPLLEDEPEKLKETVRRAMELVSTFHLEAFHPILVLNFQIGAAVLLAKGALEEELRKIVERFLHTYRNTAFPVVLQGDDYFDKVTPWLDSLELGTMMPRSTEKGQRDMLEIMMMHPAFQDYQTHPDFSALFAQIQIELNTLAEKEERHE